MDGIMPIFLEKVHQRISVQRVAIFKAVIAYGYMPRTWRKMRVVFIPKFVRQHIQYLNLKDQLV